MNERIKELAEQAGWDNHHSKFDTRIEKFAELVVRECDRYAKSAWEHGPLLGRDLLIHFGMVEAEDN